VEVSLGQGRAAELAVDALAIPVAAGEPVQGPAREIDGLLDGALSEALESREHRGRLNEVFPIQASGRTAARRVLLYGLGAVADLDGQRLRYAHHQLVRAARAYGYRSLAVLRGGPLAEDSLEAVVEGCVMGAFERRSRHTAPVPDRVPLEALVAWGFGEGREPDLARAKELGEATNRAREWQNAPANELNPEGLAREGRRIAEQHGLEIEVLGPAELRAGGYDLLMGVAFGSSQQPRLIHLRHRGRAGGPVLALIGKGVTFDSGGISLKPSGGMSKMKADMAGAAAVLSAMQVIAARRLPVDVMAVVPATENMPGGSAQRPGDVVRSANGKTVEIVDTDAEGRLILADAITYAIRQGATELVDVATLTGSALLALGHGGSIGVANDEGLWDRVARAAELAGDRVWRFPLYPDYRVLLASRIADVRNGGYGEAGAIVAGMFLQQFVEDRPWVHLDIAASAWNTNEELLTVPRGPLGTGTRLCVRLAELTARGAR
jgi:leucyl aminopeptidase